MTDPRLIRAIAVFHALLGLEAETITRGKDELHIMVCCRPRCPRYIAPGKKYTVVRWKNGKELNRLRGLYCSQRCAIRHAGEILRSLAALTGRPIVEILADSVRGSHALVPLPVKTTPPPEEHSAPVAAPTADASRSIGSSHSAVLWGSMGS